MRWICAALAFLVPIAVTAQNRAPQLMAVENAADRKPLGLAGADVRVVITGSIAETTMVLTFRNNTARVLEGELDFPLPENAMVSGFGLDMNGTMIDSVPVEREKARITYESESRKRIDPGLVEQAVGNNFHTRVYPIPANGRRTVKVQYVSEITVTKEGATYRLPLGWGQVVDDAKISVELSQVGDGTPVVNFGGNSSLPLVADSTRYLTEKTLKDVKFDSDLLVTLPPMPKQQVIVERRVKGPTVDDLMKARRDVNRTEHYFVVNDTAPLIQMDSRIDAKAMRIGVLWDASLSRLEADKTREFAVLKKLIAAMDPAGTVDLVAFRNTPDQVVSFPINDGGDALFKHLQDLTYDGGTNLNLLPIEKNFIQLPGNGLLKTVVPDYAFWILCTDGLTDLGPEMPAAIRARVHVLSNDARSNHTLLKRIAAQSGGTYFNLQRVSDDDVARTIGHEPLMMLGVDYKEGEVAEIYPRGAQLAHGRLTISGKLLVPEARISLKYGIGGVVMGRSEITLKQEGAITNGLVSRLWAQQKVADLSSDVDANKDALAAVGKEFNLVTPNTSLLVLETVDQYLQYGIVPPQTYKGVYDQFLVRIEQRKAQVAQTREERVQQVLAMWKGRVQWWETKYQYPKDLKIRDERQKDGSVASAEPITGAAALPRPASSLAPDTALHADLATAARPMAMRSREVQVVGGAGTQPADAVGDGPSISMTIRNWDPDVPYLKAMRQAGGEAAYAVYLRQRAAFIASPAFYLDCADYLFHNGQREMGIRVLTNIAELKLENAPLLRVVAHRLDQIGERDLAIHLFEKIKAMRPEEPQSYLDLGLALANRADIEATISSSNTPGPRTVADYAESLELLNHVVMHHWDRFEEIELTALMEANRIIAAVDRLHLSKEIAVPLDARLIKNLGCDVRIVLTWDADLTDVDLWVTEPSGEKCYYGHNRTVIGGSLSRDFTQGYGPEEYCLRHTMAGTYTIQCNYYGSSQISLVGPTTVQATVITNFGRPDEKREALTVRLSQQKDVVDIGKVELK